RSSNFPGLRFLEFKQPELQSVANHQHRSRIRTMPRINPNFGLISALFLLAAFIAIAQPSSKKILIAHRGASAYAPEHTAAAYRLAIEQGADFVEQDLQITKDGVLVCLHDLTLERTTNVKDLFPDRARTDVSEDQPQGSAAAKHWYVSDLSL